MKVAWVALAGVCALLLTCDVSAQTPGTPPQRQVNVTPDSPPGWRPSEAQSQAVEDRMRAYYSKLDGGDYAAAYAMWGEPGRQMMSYADWLRGGQAFHALAGAVRDRQIIRITWTKDPASAPFPGVYAAIDLVSHYANVDRHCGYIVLYQLPAGGEFQVMREESTYIDNSQARAMAAPGSSTSVDAIWAQVSAGCPNYPGYHPLPADVHA